MSDTAIETLEAIYTVLKNNANVTSKVSTRIYTQVPQNTIFPYIRLNISTESDQLLDRTDFKHRVEIQAFSQAKGNNEALTIRGYIFDALNRIDNSISISGCACSRIQATDYDVFIEDDGKTWQAFIAFDVHVSQN